MDGSRLHRCPALARRRSRDRRPHHTYTGGGDFAAAVAGFGALAEHVDLLAEFGSGEQALLLYDMHTRPFGRLRVAEHFTVSAGLIRRIRHVHDTAALLGVA